MEDSERLLDRAAGGECRGGAGAEEFDDCARNRGDGPGGLRQAAGEKEEKVRPVRLTGRRWRAGGHMEHANFNTFKTEVHRTLISKLDLEKLARVNTATAKQAVAGMVNEIIAAGGVPLNAPEREQMQSELLDEVFGLGPLEPLLRDPGISDILVNGRNQVWIERGGKLSRTSASFRDEQHLMQIIDRIVSRVGRRVDESSPMVDARLPDGSRVNAVIPPLALDGAALSIRRFGTGPLEARSLVELKSASPEILELLATAVRARISILVSGGTGAGKTTFLNILSQNIPDGERL